MNMPPRPADSTEVNVARTSSDAASSPPPVDDAATAPSHGRISRRKWFKRVLGLGAFSVASGAYGTEVEPFWVEWHDVPMPLRNLPRSFEGFRITQLTDLHTGPHVPFSYLHRVVDQVKQARPNLVVVTGDLVHHTMDAVTPVCDLLAQLQHDAGALVIATLGNHDYDVSSGYSGVPTRIADALEKRLTDHGIPCLRNRATSVDHADGRIWFVGLEDLWSGRFSAPIAFTGVDTHEPVIALSHNPDTATELDAYGAQWILAGHTHGGQVRIPGYGPLLLNVQNKDYAQGQFKLAHSSLYVSRGVGYLKQVRIFCRPEVPTFVLKSVTGE